MNNDQNILKYLNEHSNDTLMKSSALAEEISSLHSKILNLSTRTPKVENLKKLNQARILASNTLHKSGSPTVINQWNRAQSVLYELLENKSSLELNDISLLNSILTNRSSSPIRDFEISTGGGQYLSSSKVSTSLASYFKLNKKFKDDPIRQAFETYVNLVTIHPFENGNGRTARIAADFYLFKNEILPLCFKSPVQSHAALIKNKVYRDKAEIYLKFLKAIEYSYSIAFGEQT